jgi:hypothetical protein
MQVRMTTVYRDWIDGLGDLASRTAIPVRIVA